MEEGLYQRFKCLKIFNEFLCIYLDEGKGGGCTNACIHVSTGTHSQPLLQNRLMDVYETW